MSGVGVRSERSLRRRLWRALTAPRRVSGAQRQREQTPRLSVHDVHEHDAAPKEARVALNALAGELAARSGVLGCAATVGVRGTVDEIVHDALRRAVQHFAARHDALWKHGVSVGVLAVGHGWACGAWLRHAARYPSIGCIELRSGGSLRVVVLLRILPVSDECPACMDELADRESVVPDACTHAMCVPCARRHFVHHRQRECAVCRKPARELRRVRDDLLVIKVRR